MFDVIVFHVFLLLGLFVFGLASVALAQEGEDLLAELSHFLFRKELAGDFDAFLHGGDLVDNDVRGVFTLDGLDEHLQEGPGDIHSGVVVLALGTDHQGRQAFGCTLPDFLVGRVVHQGQDYLGGAVDVVGK